MLLDKSEPTSLKNIFKRMLERIPRRYHIIPVLRELHWLYMLTHKTVNNAAPEYLSDLIN